MATPNPTRTQGERAEPTRARILDAAIRAFSENGLAGARTEQIAEEAGVNKALLYYYFRSKEDLYAAALEQVVDSVRAESFSVMETKASAGERFVQIVLGNFDRSHSHPAMRSMIQQEMVRLHRGEENRIASMAEKFFRPLWVMVDRLLEEGISSGELVRGGSSADALRRAGRESQLLSLRAAHQAGHGHRPVGAARTGAAPQSGRRVPGTDHLHRPRARRARRRPRAGRNANA